jgi:hypothetical protein
MLIENTEVYGLYKSIRASGYPMGNDNFSKDRAARLGSAKPGSGHDCYLKGVVVQADVTAPQYFWLQWQRYHFHDIISSESKMHGILGMDIQEQCNEYVDKQVIEHVRRLIYTYNNNKMDSDFRRELYQRIISNCPMGLMLKARITTNYLQLKSNCHQRRGHKLEEWKIYCDWAEGLPRFREFVLGEQF